MSVNSFDELLALVGQKITYQTTNMRKPVGPEERLSVTIRYLATRNSFTSLHYEFLLGISTVGCIVKDTCQAIWDTLLPIYMTNKTTEEWVKVALQFYEYTHFPNCVGAIDGKDVRIVNPSNAGSQHFNYKHFFSLVLLALVDADNCFLAIDVGAHGKSSNYNVFKNSILGQRIENNQMNFPPPKQLPNDNNGISMPYVIVGDEAFGLSQHVLRPYPQRNLGVKKRIFNYRLTRARRMVECAYGILANKWRVFHKAIDVDVEFAQLIIQSCCVLHNYVRKKERIHFEDTMYECLLQNIDQRVVRGNLHGTANRDYFAEYLITAYGSVPWQYDKI